jgi:quinol monooxygenase YgiN
MSGYIVTDFELSIKDGKLEDFKSIVNTMVEITDVNEPNTLVYEYHINEDGTECHLLETFKDSDAFMVHLGNVGHLFDTLFQSATMTRAKIYGSPSTELQQDLDPLGVEYFAHLNGIERPSEKKTYTEQAREYARARES